MLQCYGSLMKNSMEFNSDCVRHHQYLIQDHGLNKNYPFIIKSLVSQYSFNYNQNQISLGFGSQALNDSRVWHDITH